MNIKKLIQVTLFVAMLVSAFATTTSAFAAGCGTSVTVVSGDTLRKIANRCATTVSALQRANPEVGAGNLIYPGQVLFLPGAILSFPDGNFVYIVARGDTLKGLAIRFGVTVNALVAANPDITNINLIYEGRRLNVNQSSIPVPPPPAGQTYYVKRGDTLRKIADKFGTTVNTILDLNPRITNPNVIYVGQAITLPTQVTTYIVQRGDTLRIIADRFGRTVDSLMTINPQITNPNLIYVGQLIKLW